MFLKFVMLLLHLGEYPCSYPWANILPNMKNRYTFEFRAKITENDMVGQEKKIPNECLRNVLRSLHICFTIVTLRMLTNPYECCCELYERIANETTTRHMRSLFAYTHCQVCLFVFYFLDSAQSADSP